LEVHGNESAPSNDMAYYAGLLEGKLTADLIDKQYRNTLIDYCSNKTEYCGKLSVFLERNLQFMSRTIGEMEDNPFWFQVCTVNDSAGNVLCVICLYYWTSSALTPQNKMAALVLGLL